MLGMPGGCREDAGVRFAQAWCPPLTPERWVRLREGIDRVCQRGCLGDAGRVLACASRKPGAPLDA